MRLPGTILVVDDDPCDQLMIESALRAAGSKWDLCILNDGGAAISYLKGEGRYADRARHPYPTFIITDLKMGPVDGLAVLEHLKATPRSAIIPTVVLSSSSDADDIDKAYALGASSYHVKPSTAQRFAEQIHILYHYWLTCEVPEVDEFGVRKLTCSTGRIGQRYSSDPFPGDASAKSSSQSSATPASSSPSQPP